MDADYRLLINCYGSPPAKDTSHGDIFVLVLFFDCLRILFHPGCVLSNINEELWMIRQTWK
jgi:hypothetical protein